MFIKSKIIKAFTLEAWKELGTVRRGLIARRVARKILRSNYSEEEKSILLEKLTTIGHTLNDLGKKGYGFNCSSEAHYDRDNAGLLSENNKNGVWILNAGKI